MVKADEFHLPGKRQLQKSETVSRQAIVRHQERLRAARKGSFNDLYTLATDLHTIPPSLLPDALEIFLSHLGNSELGYDDTTRSGSRHALALASLKGLGTLTLLRPFRESLFYTSRILEGWAGNLELTELLHAKILRLGTEGLLALFTSYVVAIFTGLMCVDAEGLADAITVNADARTFFASLWYNNPVNAEFYDPMVSYQLCHCFATPFDFFGTLLDTSEDPSPAEAVAKKALSRLRLVLQFSPKKEKTWSGYGGECSVILRLLHQPRQEIALELARQGGLLPILKVLRHCAAVARQGAPKCEEEQEMTTAATCFVVIYRFFNVDRGLVRKALHGGLIQSMFALAPWMETMTSIQPSFLHDINAVFLKCHQ